MTGMVANLLLNILIICLLATTIGYCWLLNRRIRILQDSKSELAQLLSHFDESTQRASESIIALQTASKKIGESIQQRIDKANYLLDDMAFMIEKGNKMANNLEAGVAVSRARANVIAQQEQEHEIEELLPVKAHSEPVRHKPEKHQTNREKTVASLEAVLERVVGRSSSKPSAAINSTIAEEEPPARNKGTQALRPRSKTEQELLEMIRGGMKG